MSLIRKHVAVLQAWACLALVNIVAATQDKDVSFRFVSVTWHKN